MADVEACLLKVMGHGVVRAAPLPMADEAGEAGELFFIEAQGLADLASCRAAAIGDDVGGHGGAEGAVAFVDVLDHLLAMVAGWQVEIDVGPLAAVFAEEALEEQL